MNKNQAGGRGGGGREGKKRVIGGEGREKKSNRGGMGNRVLVLIR